MGIRFILTKKNQNTMYHLHELLIGHKKYSAIMFRKGVLKRSQIPKFCIFERFPNFNVFFLLL